MLNHILSITRFLVKLNRSLSLAVLSLKGLIDFNALDSSNRKIVFFIQRIMSLGFCNNSVV